MQNVVRVLSTLALMGAVRRLADRYATEQRTRIDADFRGADCNLVTFTGHVALTKQ